MDTPSEPLAVDEAPDKRATGLSLSQLAIRGGGYLIGREAIGMLLRLAGVVVVIRLIGPSAFGIYTAASAFALFMASFAQMGLEVYLIRLGPAVEARRYNQAFSLLLVTSVAVTAVGEALTLAVGGLLRPIGVLEPLRVLLLCIPLNVLWAPAQAAIERRFDYRTMGMIELVGDVILYATAIPLALTHHREWSLVAGFFAWQGWLFVATWVASRLRYRWDWSWEAVREFIRHGLGFSSSDWLRRASDLVNPLVVGTFLGAAGVGYVAFAQRLVDTLGFAKRSAFRLGLVAMSRVPDRDEKRLRYSIEEGSLLQLLSLGIPFACFSVCARWIVPVVFGPQWVRGLPVYGLLALAATVGASGLVQSTFLYSRGRNLVVATTVALRVLVLGVSAVVLVRVTGLDGFGWASLGALGALGYLHVVMRQMFAFSYRKVIPWLVVLGPVIAFPVTPMPGALFLLAGLPLVALPPMRREIVRLVNLFRWAATRQDRQASSPAAEQPVGAPGNGEGVFGVRVAPPVPEPILGPVRLSELFAPDPLTGLANLGGFTAGLGCSLATLRSRAGTVGVVLVEVPEGEAPGERGFPRVQESAAWLSEYVRDSDIVARLGPTILGVLVHLPYEVELETFRSRVAEMLGALPLGEGAAVRTSVTSVATGVAVDPEVFLLHAFDALTGRAEPPTGAPRRHWLAGFDAVLARGATPFVGKEAFSGMGGSAFRRLPSLEAHP